MAATSAGLATLIVASEWVFLALKLLGAAYLAYLGLAGSREGRAQPCGAPSGGGRSPSRPTSRVPARGALKSRQPEDGRVLHEPPAAVRPWRSLPRPPGLGLLFVVLTVAWLTGYALAVERASSVLLRPGVRRALDAATGFVLVALGLRLATERR